MTAIKEQTLSVSASHFEVTDHRADSQGVPVFIARGVELNIVLYDDGKRLRVSVGGQPASPAVLAVDARCTYKDCLRGNGEGEYSLSGGCYNCGSDVVGTPRRRSGGTSGVPVPPGPTEPPVANG